MALRIFGMRREVCKIARIDKSFPTRGRVVTSFQPGYSEMEVE